LASLLKTLESAVQLPSLITPELRQRIGISFNRLDISLGGQAGGFDYTLNSLEDHLPQKEAVDTFKAWAEEFRPPA
jgi:hypothetical protein